MIRARQILAALLLCAPAGAQVERLSVVAPSLSAPAAAVPFASGAALASPAALASAFAPALCAAAPLADAPLAALPSAAVPAAAAVAPASASAPAAQRHEPPPAAAAPAAAASDPGRGLFDGSYELRTRSGAVFVPSFTAPGGFALVLSRASPAARLKSVPDTQGLYGEALLARVGALAARGQRENLYHAASRYLFATADNHSLGGLRGVTDAYSGVFIPGTSEDSRDYAETGDQAHEGWARAQAMNVEHVFPQSYFKGELPMRSDLHHLMATLEHPNGMRGNLPFGVVKKNAADYRNGAGAKRGGGVFEPPDFSKGRVARAMLYFYARYRGAAFFDASAARFWNLQVETLLEWNRRFAPTVEERRRNDQVAEFQGNRNPFVDDPALADKIGLDAWRAPAPRAAAPDAGSAAPRRSDTPRRGKPRASFHRPHRARSGRR